MPILIVSGASLWMVGCEKQPNTPEPAKAAASAPTSRHVGQFEFRLAAHSEVTGYQRMATEVPAGNVFVASQTLLTAEDVREVTVQEDVSGRPAFEIRLTPAATAKFAAVTRENVKKSIAIVAGGKVLMAPTIEAEIADGVLHIVGDRTPAEIERIRAVLIGER